MWVYFAKKSPERGLRSSPDLDPDLRWPWKCCVLTYLIQTERISNGQGNLPAGQKCAWCYTPPSHREQMTVTRDTGDHERSVLRTPAALKRWSHNDRSDLMEAVAGTTSKNPARQTRAPDNSVNTHIQMFYHYTLQTYCRSNHGWKGGGDHRSEVDVDPLTGSSSLPFSFTLLLPFSFCLYFPLLSVRKKDQIFLFPMFSKVEGDMPHRSYKVVAPMYTGHSVLAGNSSKKLKILLKQSFTAHMRLLMETSIFRLGKLILHLDICIMASFALVILPLNLQATSVLAKCIIHPYGTLNSKHSGQ